MRDMGIKEWYLVQYEYYDSKSNNFCDQRLGSNELLPGKGFTMLLQCNFPFQVHHVWILLEHPSTR